MKVILLVDTKEGKKGDIVEVSDGYGVNFLIRNKKAIPFNKITKRKLEQEKKKDKEILDANIARMNKIKKEIESISLSFTLKEKNNVIFGSITKKQIYQALREKNIIIGKHAIENVHITSLGTTIIPVNLEHKITAKLKVEVKNV